MTTNHDDTMPDQSSNHTSQAPEQLSAEDSTAVQPVQAADPYPPFRFTDLPETLRRAVNDCGWSEPMPVQARVIPWLLHRHDLIVQSQTGSGKTGAFVLPLLQMIDPTQPTTQALIMVPTRELAQQVKTECDRLGAYHGVRAAAVYGGVGYVPQIEAFKRGAHIVVGTPGRLLDHLNRRNLSLAKVQFLVIDEADELLSMGFWPDVRRIRAWLPKNRVSALFSATIPGGVRVMADELLHQPQFLGLSSDAVHVTDMDHIYYVVDAMQKDRVLMRILEVENPSSAIIFCNTRSEVEYLSAFLRRFGYDVDQISGDISQRDRESVMKRLKDHSLRLMVATDVAARGIDVSKLEYVFIYDFPPDVEQYVHRAGRTGRAGNRGVAVSLVSVIQEGDVKRCARRHGIPFIKKNTPTPEEVQNRLAERLMARLEGDLRDLDTAGRERMKGFQRLLTQIQDHEQSTELLLMLLDEKAARLRAEGRPEPPPAAIPETRDRSSDRGFQGRGRRPQRR